MNSCASSSADVDLLQPDELADAVVDVDDEIADLQVAEVGEERLASQTAALSCVARSSSKTSVSA